MPKTQLKRKDASLENEITGNGHEPISAVLTRAVERVCSLTCADGAAIALSDPKGVLCQASTGHAPDVGSRLQSDSRFTSECFGTGQVVLCEDAENDSRVRPSTAKSLHLRSAVAVPIQTQGSILGVVEVFSSRPSAFDTTHVASLQRIADLLAPILVPQTTRFILVPPVLLVDSPRPPNRTGEGGMASTGIFQRLAGKTAASRAWFAGAGVALFLLLLLLLLFFFAELHHSLTKGTPVTAISPRADEARIRPRGTGTRETVEAQRLSGADRSSRSEVPPPTASSSTAQREKPGGPGSPKFRAIPVVSAPVPPTDASPAADQPNSKAVAELKPLELPISTEAAKAPILAPAPAPPTPPPVRSTNISVPNFVLDRTLRGHTNWVTSVAFTADGQRLASGSWDQTVKLWDVPTGQELNTVGRKMKEVQTLAFSRDGRWLAAENSANTVTLWDVTAGLEPRTLPGNKPLGVLGSSWVYSIAFSPDGRWLASGVDDKTIRLWDVKTGRAVRDLAALRRSVIYIAFSPDGRWLASGGDDRTIRIWEVSTGQEIQRLSGHKKAIYAAAFSPNGRWLASASVDKSVKLWDVVTGHEVHTLTGHGSAVTSLAFSPDGRWLASGSRDKTIKIWDVEAGREVQTLAGHNHPIYTIAFDSRGRWLASGSEDGTIKLWRLGEFADQIRLR